MKKYFKVKLFAFAAALAVALLPSYGLLAADQGSAGLNSALASDRNEEEFEVYSQSMKKPVKNLAVLPSSYKSSQKRYPVIYLLHGFGGNYSTWAHQTKPNLQQLADAYDVIFVCPDGARSWYWDSPKNPSLRYETYVSKELVEAVDAKFRTIPRREARAITGFSMGGHGGLWLGFRHQDIFKNCGSMSGGVDIRPFPKNWDMERSLGSYAENPEIWDSHTVINQMHLLPQNGAGINIIIDCGYQDFFYKVNEALHEKLLKHNIQHEYTVRAGAHTHQYWNNSIDYQTMFFVKNFYRDGACAQIPQK